MTQVIIEDFKAIRKNSLLGFAKVRMPSGLVFNDCPVCTTNGKVWASPASKPAMTAAGTQLIGANGKQHIVGFASTELRNKWSDAVIAALRQSHPQAFEG
jgi:hypothetical protein